MAEAAPVLQWPPPICAGNDLDKVNECALSKEEGTKGLGGVRGPC